MFPSSVPSGRAFLAASNKDCREATYKAYSGLRGYAPLREPAEYYSVMLQETNKRSLLIPGGKDVFLVNFGLVPRNCHADESDQLILYLRALHVLDEYKRAETGIITGANGGYIASEQRDLFYKSAKKEAIRLLLKAAEPRKGNSKKENIRPFDYYDPDGLPEANYLLGSLACGGVNKSLLPHPKTYYFEKAKKKNISYTSQPHNAGNCFVE